MVEQAVLLTTAVAYGDTLAVDITSRVGLLASPRFPTAPVCPAARRGPLAVPGTCL
jgi:hypothetical protein